jgi:hypothetical protein
MQVNYTFTGVGAIQSNAGYTCQRGIGTDRVANVFNFYYSAGIVYSYIDSTYMGSLNLTSDYRIKKDVLPLPGMWDTVKALRPIQYKHTNFTPSVELEKGRSKDDPFFEGDDLERWGFVAHELQEVMVESAATSYKDAPDAIQSLNQITIIAALTKALQEAMARIEALEAR